MGGYALEAQWSYDLHHSLHTLLTGEQQGYYADFGKPEHLATCLREGWFYSGQYSQFRQRRHGNSPRGLSGSRFVVFSQNHDQVGNRAFGERLSQLVGLEDLKLAAGIVLLSPFVPLLFMGEEYGETAPFQYFTSHSDPDLAEAVRKGRRAEFSHFGWQSEVPDPQSEATFQNSKLDHRRKNQEPHRTLLRFYRKLIQMRSRFALGKNHKVEVLLHDRAPVVAILRGSKNSKKLAAIFHFGQEVRAMDMPMPQGSWKTVLNSAEEMWLGPARPSSEPVDFSNHAAMQLHPRSFVVMKQTGAAE